MISAAIPCILWAACTPTRSSQVCTMTDSTCDRVVLLVREKVGLAPEDELSVDAPLLDGGVWLDSVMVLELLLELEGEFGVELVAEELQEAGAMGSCARLARFIDTKREGL